jgi:hypothetical protein
MNEPLHKPSDSRLSADTGLQQQLRARFEQACAQGQRPRIEDYLAVCPDADRTSLFPELLTIELAWRRQADEQPTVKEYTHRFPEQTEAIVAAFPQTDFPTAPLLAQVVDEEIDEPLTRVMASPPAPVHRQSGSMIHTAHPSKEKGLYRSRVWWSFGIVGAGLVVLLILAVVWRFWLAGQWPGQSEATPTVLDFKEIHGADLRAFKAWGDGLEGAGLLPVCLSTRAGGAEPRFNGVAIANRKKERFNFSWIRVDDKHEDTWNKFYKYHNNELGPKCGLLYMQSARVTEVLIWGQGGPWESRLGPLAYVNQKVNAGRKLRRRPVSLSATSASEAERKYSCQMWPDEGLNWDVHYSLDEKGLEKLFDAQRARGWRPDVLSCFWDGKEVRFMTVLVENPGKTNWSFRKDMPTAAYEQALVEENARGMRPIAVASYLPGAETRYAAVWRATLEEPGK